MKIKPINAALGAEVTGLNLADLSEQDFQTLYDAWLHYCVLVVRQQSLTENSRPKDNFWCPITVSPDNASYTYARFS